MMIRGRSTPTQTTELTLSSEICASDSISFSVSVKRLISSSDYLQNSITTTLSSCLHLGMISKANRNSRCSINSPYNSNRDSSMITVKAWTKTNCKKRRRSSWKNWDLQSRQPDLIKIKAIRFQALRSRDSKRIWTYQWHSSSKLNLSSTNFSCSNNSRLFNSINKHWRSFSRIN